MKYNQFKNTVMELPVFRSSDFYWLSGNRQVFKNQISAWKKEKRILALKKGLYVLNEYDRKTTPSREFVANQLVFPSYVSMEYALSFYGMIPEKTFQVTSVTTKKTRNVQNAFGNFVYRSMKTSCFFGYLSIRDENGLSVLMAEKEKALLDFVYLNLDRFSIQESGRLRESHRMQNLEDLNRTKLDDYAARFDNRKLVSVIQSEFGRA
jgi:predicted transcriptional regulator of viral defense system